MSRNEDFEAGVAARNAAVAQGKTTNIYGAQTQADGSRHYGTNLMLGDMPSGATSAVVHSSGEARVYKGKQNIGVLDLAGGGIDHIQTHSDYRRMGVATAMHRMGNFARGRAGYGEPIKHGTIRTELGDAWAKKVGGDLPEKVPSFGIRGSRLENL